MSSDVSTAEFFFHMVGLGQVQTSCFCRAELNSEIKQSKGTAEAQRLNQNFNYKHGKICPAIRLWHGSDSDVVHVEARRLNWALLLPLLQVKECTVTTCTHKQRELYTQKILQVNKQN